MRQTNPKVAFPSGDQTCCKIACENQQMICWSLSTRHRCQRGSFKTISCWNMFIFHRCVWETESVFFQRRDIVYATLGIAQPCNHTLICTYFYNIRHIHYILTRFWLDKGRCLPCASEVKWGKAGPRLQIGTMSPGVPWNNGWQHVLMNPDSLFGQDFQRWEKMRLQSEGLILIDFACVTLMGFTFCSATQGMLDETDPSSAKSVGPIFACRSCNWQLENAVVLHRMWWFGKDVARGENQFWF